MMTATAATEVEREWCDRHLREFLGADDAEAASFMLSPLYKLLFFKMKDSKGLERWARAWQDSWH